MTPKQLNNTYEKCSGEAIVVMRVLGRWGVRVDEMGECEVDSNGWTAIRDACEEVLRGPIQTRDGMRGAQHVVRMRGMSTTKNESDTAQNLSRASLVPNRGIV